MFIKNTLTTFYILALLTLPACGDDAELLDTNTASQAKINTAPNQVTYTEKETLPVQSKNQFNIGNKRYLFDVSTHSVEELRALLSRIEEITEASPEAFDELEMVMVLHGPDIDLFTQQNYKENKQLVDLAAKLDAFKVVDMKACKTAMNSLGVEEEEIPEFIELVPYAPDTLRELEREGYINL